MKNKEKLILDLCGGTGSWSKPYRDAGYHVEVVTIPEHDVRHYDAQHLWGHIGVYGILAAPPCTMFSFARTNAKKPRDLQEGMECVRACLDIIWKQMEIQQATGKKTLPLKFWALENPYRGFLPKFLGKPAMVFNPWEFGDPYTKETAIWGNFNEPIKTETKKPKTTKFDYLPTREIHGEFYGKYDRQTRRSITPEGFAKAFFEANP
jgi:hypothetical protein